MWCRVRLTLWKKLILLSRSPSKPIKTYKTTRQLVTSVVQLKSEWLCAMEARHCNCNNSDPIHKVNKLGYEWRTRQEEMRTNLVGIDTRIAKVFIAISTAWRNQLFVVARWTGRQFSGCSNLRETWWWIAAWWGGRFRTNNWTPRRWAETWLIEIHLMLFVYFTRHKSVSSLTSVICHWQASNLTI